MLKAEHLYFSYTGAPPYILEDLNLSVEEGAYISILGENGSGKSTLVRLLLGLLHPTRGSIDTGAKRVGYVAQKSDANNSQFPITVWEMLNAYRRLLGIKDGNAVINSLEQMHMADYTNALMGSLSGGQTQKILIARALMGSPRLLILDEPSSGIDIKGQKEIYTALRKLNRENGITILSVEHNLKAAMVNSTMIFHLEKSRGHLCTPEKYAAEFLNGEEDEKDA